MRYIDELMARIPDDPKRQNKVLESQVGVACAEVDTLRRENRGLREAVEYALPLLDIVLDIEAEEQDGPCAPNRARAAKIMFEVALAAVAKDGGRG